MNKYIISLVCALLIGTLSINAEITGNTCIDINGSNIDALHVYDVDLHMLSSGGEQVRIGDIGYTRVRVSGGIELVRVDTLNSQVIIRSKKGETKDELFSKWCRGRIEVRYGSGTSSDCGYWMHLDVSKHFDIADHDYDNAFQVNGPSCVAPGDTVVFSVPPLVTMAFTANHDTYDWDLGGLVLPGESNVLYWSSDYSAVTLVAPDNISDDFISVVLGSCNASTHNLLTRSIYSKPAEPIITGPSCWEESRIITFNISNPSSDVNYTWVVNNDTLLTNTTAISLDVDIDYVKDLNKPFLGQSSFKVTVYANPIGGSCFGTVRGTYELYKGILPETSITKESENLDSCFSRENLEILKVNQEGVAVIWELPQGWTSDVDKATTKSGITPQGDAVNGVITVKSLYSECKREVSYNAYIKPSIDSISGSDKVESGNTYTYTAHGSGALSYEWVIPDGYSYTTSTSNTISITVLNNGQSISPIKVRAVGAGGCEGDYDAKTIGVAPTTPSSISFKNLDGTARTCNDINMVNTFVMYTDPIDINHSFVWDLGNWGIITSPDPNSNEIIVTTDKLIAGVYTVKVKSTTAYGSFESSVYSKDTTIVDDYSFVAIPNDYSYELHKNSIKVDLTSSTVAKLYKNNILLTVDPRGDSICVVYDSSNQIELGTRRVNVNIPLDTRYRLEVTHTYSDGCKVYKEYKGMALQSVMLKSASVNTKARRNSSSTMEKLDSNLELFTFDPNPADNFVNLKLNEFDSTIPANYKIYNSNGLLVHSNEITKIDTKINISDLNTGTYIIAVKYGERMKEKKIIKK